MLTKIKICGVKTPEIAKFAVGAGADYIGVIFFPKSPRNITYNKAADISKAISGNAKLVSVMVNPDDSEIEEMLSHFRPDYIQLHGNETVDRVKYIKEKFEIPLIKAIPVSSLSDIKKAKKYGDYVEFLLFDAKPPKNSKIPGGNAVSFDWKLLSDVALDKKFFLSGGIDISNVDEAISATAAKYIDVSSSLESVRGQKSKKLISAFLKKLIKCKK